MRNAATRPRVLHLDHAVVEGGAEYALQRMFAVGPLWQALLLLPRTASFGVFAARGDVRAIRAGVRQPAGVSEGGLRVVSATARLLAQAVMTRLHPAFRSADVIDANTARAAAYGALAVLGSDRQFVVHLRDMVDAQALGRAGHALMTRVILPRADGVVTDTRATLASAERYLRPDALTAVIPSASGLRPRGTAVKRSPAPLRVGMLARIDPWKGQAVLVDAFADAFAESDALLEFAGGAPFGHEAFIDELRRRSVERGIADRVRFLGHVEDVDTLLDSWHIAVHASTRPEPLGQNVLQYLAAGCATVVADEGGPTEFVNDGENGLCVPPRDSTLLAAALRRLGDDPPLRDRLGRAAASTPGLLSDLAVVEAHAAFYTALVRRHPDRWRRHRS